MSLRDTQYESKMKIKRIKGGVTAPKGFIAGGTHCGIKAARKLDLALVVSARPARAAAVFTRNKFAAASVLLGRRLIKGAEHRAVAVNSGNANSCTGEQGMKGAVEFGRLTAKRLEVPAARVLVASTGHIGRPLPVGKISSGLRRLRLSSSGGLAAARGIMTTDTVPKELALEAKIAGGVVRLGGMSKGAGMIAPDMATMIAVLTTDADIPKAALGRMLKRAVDLSFNCLSVDGDSSTNDSVFLLANGGGGAVLRSARQLAAFGGMLDELCLELTRMMAADAEGAGRYLEVSVAGAVNDGEARRAAKSVVESLLFKCAVAGGDPNWGRIAVALGGQGLRFRPQQVEIRLGGQVLFRRGGPVRFDRARARSALKRRRVEVGLKLGGGRGCGRAFGCDLTQEYVRINMEYS